MGLRKKHFSPRHFRFFVLGLARWIQQRTGVSALDFFPAAAAAAISQFFYERLRAFGRKLTHKKQTQFRGAQSRAKTFLGSLRMRSASPQSATVRQSNILPRGCWKALTRAGWKWSKVILKLTSNPKLPAHARKPGRAHVCVKVEHSSLRAGKLYTLASRRPC